MDHGPIPDGDWWACAHPERPPDEHVTHYWRGCPQCWPAFITAGRNPLKTFYFKNDSTLRSVHDPQKTEAWWFRQGEYADT